MGKKKGKKQDENWDEKGADDIKTLTLNTEEDTVVTLPQKGGGGKKGKKKKAFDDDDIDAELLAIANEETMMDTTSSQEVVPEKTTPPVLVSQSPPAGGKKGKKGRKKDWDEDDLLLEIEQISTGGAEPTDTVQEDTTSTTNKPDSNNSSETTQASGGGGGGGGGDNKKNKKGKKAKKTDDDIDQLLMAIEGTSLEETTPIDDTPTEGEFHVKTKAEKKEAKKEKARQQKEATKKQQQQPTKIQNTEEEAPSTQPSTSLEQATPNSDQTSISVTSVPTTSVPTNSEQTASVPTTSEQTASVPTTSEQTTSVPVTSDPINESQGATNEIPDNDGGEGEGEGDDDKDKKKKKKKKKASDKEEDKKAKAKKGKTAAVQKMKDQIEALRQAQKKREEEELAKIRAAEEAERLRLEQIQLEKERKERKKQKEKEKRERLKKEGKLLSKAEKEKRTRANMHLQALVAQGIIVPQKTDGTEKKGPVRYGSKVKKQKQEVKSLTDETESTIDDGIETMSEAASIGTEEASVKDNWDDEEEEDNVKETWEEVSDDEEEDDTKDLITPSIRDTTTSTVIPQATPLQSVDANKEEESEGDSDDSDSESSDSENEEDMTPYDKAAKRIKERRSRHHNERSPDLLRSPVVCVLGHVDTGKTKILDKIRHTNVQDGEAGGITQQIGATFVPPDAIQEQTKMIKEFQKMELKVPGLLIIDTPGHESFSNLRTRGSSMCDIAILVVDIMHGLEPQTIESLNLLRKGNVPFVVALNKIDRLYNWVRNPTGGIKDTLKRQKPNTKSEFDERVESVVLQFAEQGMNAALYWDKVDFTDYIAMVPTSAHSGDGMGDLISLIVTHSQQFLVESLMFSKEVEAIVLEVKVIGGLGTTIDVILRNGILNEGDTLILAGTDGPIVTQARALLMPQPLRELRVKNAYINHKTIIASQGVKITGRDLEKTLAGMPLLVAKKPDEVEVLKEEAATTMSSILNTFKLTERGVFVQASTLGSLEALVEFLKTSKIPYAGVNIGPVHKKDVMKASVMLERDNQWACILAFDVKVEREAQELADNLGVRIFTAEIIYHLFDSFMKYREELKERKRREHEHIAVFPCKLKILPDCVFNARNPIIVGVSIVDGAIKPGTPLVVPSKEFIHLGTVSSIEFNHKSVDIARKGSEVCIKIEPTSGEAPKLFGRHFDYEDLLVSKISRESIDAVKNYFRDDLQKSDWKLIVELKKIFRVY